MLSAMRRLWPLPFSSSNRRFLAFGLGVVAIFLAATWMTVNRERQAAETLAQTHSANLARAVEEHVIATVRSIDQLLLNIARDFRRDPDRFDLRYWVRNSDLILGGSTTGLWITDAQGMVDRKDLGKAPHSIADREYFAIHRDRLADGLFIAKPVVARGTGRWSIQFTRRLERPDGSFAGIVTLGLDPDYFANFYQSLSIGELGAIGVIGLDGTVRAYMGAGDRSVGQSVADSELFRRLPMAQSGSYISTDSSDKIERLTAYRRLRDYPLAVSIGLSTAESLGPYRKFRGEVLLGATVLSILLLISSVVLMREIVRRHESEILLQTLLEAAPTTIHLKDSDLRLRWANRAYLSLVPPKVGSPIGKRISDFMGNAPHVAEAEAIDREVLRTGRRIADIEQQMMASGDRVGVHMLVTKTPILGPDGTVQHILTIGTDVTALRRAETEVAAVREAGQVADAARAEVDRLLLGMPTVVYHGMIDLDGHVTIEFVTDNVATITGRTSAEVVGAGGWYDHLGPDAVPDIAAFFRRANALGEAQTDYYVPHRGGIWIRDRARVVAMKPEGTEIIGNWTDISREHAMAQQVIESAKRATLGELATGLAHEINQPIAVMALAAENADDALATGPLGIKDARTRLGRIMEQAQRAKNIVSHLRVFGRTDDGPMEPIALEDAVTGALSLVGSLLQTAGIQVEVHLPPELPFALGRLVLIENVIVNLCVNARDAMHDLPPERRVLRIEGATRPHGLIELRIVDQGGGIPISVMPRLFEPFFTTKSPQEGTGLGLSISHGMMQSMGGSLAVSNSETGASFALSLRAAPALVGQVAE